MMYKTLHIRLSVHKNFSNNSLSKFNMKVKHYYWRNLMESKVSKNMDVAKLTPKRLFFDLNQTLVMKTDGDFFSRKTGMNLNKARKSSKS